MRGTAVARATHLAAEWAASPWCRRYKTHTGRTASRSARPRRVAGEHLAWHLRHGASQASAALRRRQVRRALRRREYVGELPLGVAAVHVHLAGGEPPPRPGRVACGGGEELRHEAVEAAGGGGGHRGEVGEVGQLHLVVGGGEEVDAGEAHVAGVVVHAHVRIEGALELRVAEARLEAHQAGVGDQVAAAQPGGVHGLVGAGGDCGGGEEVGGGGGVGGESVGDSAEAGFVGAAGRVAAAAAATVAGRRRSRVGRWRVQHEDQHGGEEPAVHGVLSRRDADDAGNAKDRLGVVAV